MIRLEGAGVPGLSPLAGRVRPPPEPSTPFGGEGEPGYIGEAFRLENTIVSAIESFTRQTLLPTDPDYDPRDDPLIKGTYFEQYYMPSFVYSRSRAETKSIIARIEREEQAREIIARGGFGAGAAIFVAALADPTILIPIGGWLSVPARVGRAGRVALGAVEGAAVVGGAVGLQETVLQATQVTRPTYESIFNVAASAVLGAALGGAIGAVSKARLAQLGEMANRGIPSNAADEAAMLDAMTAADLPASELRGTAEPGIVAYHGSPHDFDKFSMERIGTGEGAQAYGHGLYFAEERGTSDSYRKALAGARSDFSGKVGAELKAALKAEGNLGFDTPGQAIAAMRTHADWPQRWDVQNADRVRAAFEAHETAKYGGQGSLYKVRINATADEFLDWDKPLSEQSAKVQELFKGDLQTSPLFPHYGERAAVDMTIKGDVLYQQLGKKLALGPNKDISEAFRAAGIKGIRYKDAGSRGAEGGTSNYVIFDESIIDVLAKDGVPVAGVEPGTAAGISAVGAQVSTSGRTTGKPVSALGLDRALSKVEPVGRAMASPSIVHRQVMLDIAETALTREDSAAGVVSSVGGPVEAMVREWEWPRLFTINEWRRLYSDYVYGAPDARFAIGRAFVDRRLGRTQKMSFAEFREEIFKAWYSGDKHAIPQVAEAARIARQRVFDPLKNRATELRVEGFSRDMEPPSGDLGYAPRDYDTAAIGVDKEGFQAILIRGLERAAAQARERHVARWAQKVEELETAAGESARWTLERLNKARARLSDAEAKIAEGLSDAEKAAIADDITNKIMAQSPGRLVLPADLVPGLRGSLKARVLNFVTTAELAPYLHRDAGALLTRHTRTLASDLALKEKFGETSMAGELARVGDDYDRLYKAVPTVTKEGKPRPPLEIAREKKQLNALKTMALRDLAAQRDRIRHTYGIPDNPNGLASRTFRVVRDLNYMRYLGMVTPSSLPDLGKIVFLHGLGRTMKTAWYPFVNGMRKIKLSVKDMRTFGTGLDMWQDQRMMALADIADDAGARGTWLEQAIHTGAENFSYVNLLAYWNSFVKGLSGVVIQTRMLEAIDRLGRGKRIPKKEMAFLADNYITPEMARRISSLVDKHGEKGGDVWWANTEAWIDSPADIAAAKIYGRGVARAVDMTVVTRGLDFPLFMSKDIGKTLGQFKSFAFASQQRTLLAGLQQRDAAVLNGAIMMMALGAMRYWLGAQAAGYTPSSDPKKWIAEGFDRSGIAGWLMDANNIAEIATGGRLGLSAFTGETVSRYAGRNIVQATLGPSASFATELAQITRAIATGEVSASDIHTARKLIPLNNLLILSKGFDAMERNVNAAFGIPMRRQ